MAENRENAIVMTGATGYLGSRTLKRLVDLGFEIVVLKRSFSDVSRIGDYLARVAVFNVDERDIRSLFEETRVAAILHLAANYGRKTIDPSKTMEDNVIFPLRLLHLGREHGIRGFLNVDTSLPPMISPYSLSKRQFADWLSLYCQDAGGFKAVNVELEHFYGPFAGETNFVSMVIATILSACPSLALTGGDQRRVFIYIDDAADALATIISRLASFADGFNRIEVGSGQSVSIRELVQLIAKTCPDCKTKFNFGELPYRKNEMMESKADLADVSRLGWRPRVSLPDGIARTVELEKRKGG
ncbi:MAG: NAD(P)-dependent oxidoreductase [Nitrospinae bacterium]|nr:NAD(P)-dependent oxidoreductase [Nitrospinota bacterium]